jgi:MazG family protein
MATLRSEDGCPWDRAQDLKTLKSYCLEECYEVLEAIDSGKCDQHRDELGDLLLQIIFQSQIRSEEGAFDALDVCRTITDKLLRRHPEIFGNGPQSAEQRSDEDPKSQSAEDAHRAWEAIKAAERAAQPQGHKSALSGIPRALPALLRAQRLAQKAALHGFDWEAAADVLPKVREEWDELGEALVSSGPGSRRASEELGDLLFSITNLARHLGIDAEDALRNAGDRFAGRFGAMETAAEAEGRALSQRDASELEAMWQSAKEQRAEAEGL